MNVALATLGGAEATTPVVSKIVVQKVNNQQVVFVATKESNVFAMRRVRLGIESNGFFPVLEGLSTGERVVTEGSFLLRAEWLSHMRRIESNGRTFMSSRSLNSIRITACQRLVSLRSRL